MKKIILFALLLSVTAIGNNIFAASKSTALSVLNQEKLVVKDVLKISSKNAIEIEQAVKAFIAKDEQIKNLAWVCFVTDVTLEYVSTAPDGTDYYNITIGITCYYYKSAFETVSY